jgi:hypothetical protein
MIQSGSITIQLTPKPTSAPARVGRPRASQTTAKALGSNGGPATGWLALRAQSFDRRASHR